MTLKVEINDTAVKLLRQIYPGHVLTDGGISSAAFVPGPDHHGLLSTRHERVGARRAHDEYCALGNETAGTWAVTVGEVVENGVSDGIVAVEDGGIDGAPDGHVSIDFNASPSTSATKRIARHLARRAAERGKQHPQDEPRDSHVEALMSF